MNSLKKKLLRAQALLNGEDDLQTFQDYLADWTEHGRRDQQPPDTDWSTWLLLGGRGSGKTRAGAEWVRAMAKAYPGARIALIGPAFHDVREVMIEGGSGIKAICPPPERPRWQSARRRLTWPNGSVAYAFSSEDPEALRGPQFHYAWADEFCVWRRPAETLAMLRFGLRLGDDPRCVVTTTPKPLAALRALIAEPGTAREHAPTSKNAENLAPSFLANLEKIYGGTRLAAQELEGLIVEDDAMALWRAADLAACRGSRPPVFDRIVVAVDPPATSTGDACGIIVAGRRGETAYILEDRTILRPSPTAWADVVVAAAQQHDADAIVAESNQGGEMIRALLVGQGADCPIRLVHARQGKRVRAEPVAALYERGRVVHCAAFPALEEELMALGGEGGKSPDRADALVWALTDLMLGQRGNPRLRRL